MSYTKQSAQSNADNFMCGNERTPESKSRLCFWELDHFFKCPVVGTCLTSAEQKQLLKKNGISIKRQSPFEIHETLVACSESENRLSRRADNLLNRKFGKKAAALLRLDNAEFMAYFKTAFEAGDYDGVLWAAATSPNLSSEHKREIFGRIHMAMHSTSEQTAQLKRKLAGQQKEISGMLQNLHNNARHRRSLQKENERLKKKAAELKAVVAARERQNAQLQANFAGLESGPRIALLEQENRFLITERNTLALRLKSNQQQTDTLREKNRQLSAELGQQRAQIKRIRQETQEIIARFVTLNSCDSSCPSFDLCKKRVLIVGGITRMEALYRDLIESSGGVFEYHNGYLKNGVKQLESRLKRADVVLCPVNCNSHNACSVVKSLAKKHKKTVHMLANSSLSAVSQAIWCPSGNSRFWSGSNS